MFLNTGTTPGFISRSAFARCTQILISTTSKMASLAANVRGAAPTSVENATRPSECDDTDSHTSMVLVLRTNKVANNVKEKNVRDTLAKRLQGEIEWLTPSGSIDVFTRTEVIEVKHFKHWKSGIGQVISYGAHHPSHNKRLHLFAHKGDARAWKYFEMATRVCAPYDVQVTFEEVLPGSNNLGLSEVRGIDVFPKATSGMYSETPMPKVTGQKRPASATVVKRHGKRERLARSTDASDAAGLEFLREMNALYVAEVEKLCVLPSLKGVVC